MFGLDCNGGDEEDRTLDLTDANRTLSQLSYAPRLSLSIIIAQPEENFKSFFLKSFLSLTGIRRRTGTALVRRAA